MKTRLAVSCIFMVLFTPKVLADGMMAVLTLCGKPLILVIDSTEGKAVIDMSVVPGLSKEQQDHIRAMIEAVPNENVVTLKMDKAAKAHGIGLICEKDRT